MDTKIQGFLTELTAGSVFINWSDVILSQYLLINYIHSAGYQQGSRPSTLPWRTQYSEPSHKLLKCLTLHSYWSYWAVFFDNMHIKLGIHNSPAQGG